MPVEIVLSVGVGGGDRGLRPIGWRRMILRETSARHLVFLCQTESAVGGFEMLLFVRV